MIQSKQNSDATALKGSAKSTDPRDRNIDLGIDSPGMHHIYQTRLERVVVVDPDAGEIIHVRDLVGRLTVDDWVATITKKRGWDDRRYGVPLVEMLVESLEGDR